MLSGIFIGHQSACVSFNGTLSSGFSLAGKKRRCDRSKTQKAAQTGRDSIRSRLGPSTTSLQQQAQSCLLPPPLPIDSLPAQCRHETARSRKFSNLWQAVHWFNQHLSSVSLLESLGFAFAHLARTVSQRAIQSGKQAKASSLGITEHQKPKVAQASPHSLTEKRREKFSQQPSPDVTSNRLFWSWRIN